MIRGHWKVKGGEVSRKPTEQKEKKTKKKKRKRKEVKAYRGSDLGLKRLS